MKERTITDESLYTFRFALHNMRLVTSFAMKIRNEARGQKPLVEETFPDGDGTVR